MKINLASTALLAGILPAAAVVLPDENTQSILAGLNREISLNEDARDMLETFEERLEKKLDQLVHELTEDYTDDVDDYGLTALDKAFDDVFVDEQDVGGELEYFDAEAWISQSRYANDQVFISQEENDNFCSAMGRHRKHGGRGRRTSPVPQKYRKGGSPDDTDPLDGTDPGDGPPYHRDPKEPPHHTPNPGSGIPHVHKPPMPPRDRNGPHSNSTLLDLISHSKHTSKFYDVLKEHKDLCDMLDDPKGNITVFIPANHAFEKLERIHGDIHKLPKDKLRRVLLYHMSKGTHYSEDLKYHNTLMSLLPEEELGKGIHQRLRMGLSYYGPTVNFYSEVVMADIFAKNGVIHGLDAILLPPPQILDILEILPIEFSTTETALYRTGLIDELKHKDDGLTIFLPSNRDWQKLGFLATAFLFSHEGNPYLRAVMKYHIVPGHSLYSDAHVVPSEKKTSDERDDPSGLTHGYSHAYLPTLLKDRYISADINRYERFLSFRENGRVSTIISDGIARNGVIQVPDNVLIPPHGLDEHRNPPEMFVQGGKKEGGKGPDEISVEELKDILGPFVQNEREEIEALRLKGYEFEEL